MLRISGSVALAFVWLANVAFAHGNGADEHPAREVLADTMVPIHYDLALAPDSQALTFRGKVKITITVNAATADVVLNAVGLAFEHVRADDRPADAIVSVDDKLERAKLHFGAPLEPGAHVLTIDYSGKISHSTLGLFAMDYASPAGPRRTLATNFEPAHARQLLPCWDEPARKATFTVTVDAPKDRLVVSNMPAAETTAIGSSLQRVRFAETPKMSTYLLFVAVGDFERIHKVVDGTDVGVVVKRGDAPKAAYALEQAARLLQFYNGYFNIRYPLPKLDLVAAPGSIQGSSMENWGAIFYSQGDLLFDPAKSTEADRQRVFLVVSHEMAHQWFGDLVTMAWWDDLWLNEGFARWMQTFAAGELHPEWQTGLQAASIFELGKRADAVPSTHPVVQEVFTAAQAEQAFDYITYDKGAAVITMIAAYVGHDNFRDGVRSYMHEHAYGNTVDSDLWSIMQRTVGKPILAIEHDFTRQVGVPLVRVTATAKGTRLLLGRFAQDPATITGEPPQKWRLPLVAGPIMGSGKTILLEGETTLEAGPLLINMGQTGYARVLYDNSFDALASHFGQLAPIDQLGLLNDASALGNSGYAPADRLLTLLSALPADANPVVWTQVIRLLDRLDIHYTDAPQRAVYRSFALHLLAPLAARLGTAALPTESSNIAVLRTALAQAQATFGDAAVMERARKTFDSHGGTAAEQRTALSIVAAHADPATFDNLLDKARQADPLEKEHIFEALSRVSDPVLARRMVDIALSDEVPAGSSPTLLDVLARKHPDMVWRVMGPRLDDPTLHLDPPERWELAASIAASSADPARIADLQAYESRSVPENSRRPLLAAEAA
ncbi:MAG TPA: M1 family metallopeptidase, partial [Steroidobacteraceae bacterium]